MKGYLCKYVENGELFVISMSPKPLDIYIEKQTPIIYGPDTKEFIVLQIINVR